VVQRGGIDLFRQLAEGGEELVHTSGPGEYFGELAPLFGFPRSATARAAGDTELIGYTAQQFREMVGPEGIRKAMGRNRDPELVTADA
jgi:putative ABC transport system ATP-binding protein